MSRAGFMKKLSIYIALLLLVLSCQKNDVSKFTIEGKDVKTGVVYLWGTDKKQKEITSIRSNGNFTMSIELKDTTTFTLVLPDGKFITLFAEPGLTATVQPDSTLKSGWSVSGNKTQAIHDSISRVLDAVNSIEKQKKIIDDFAKAHPISEINVELFRRYLIEIPNPDNEYLRKAISKLGGALQDHQYFATKKKLLDKKTGDVKHRMFPTFQYTTIDDKKVNLGEYSGKYLLVNFWSTWCGDNKSIKELRDFREKIKSENFAILNISFDNDSAKWKETILNDSIIGDNVLDRKGLNSDILTTFNIRTLPYSVLITPYKRISEYNLRLDSVAVALIDSLTQKHDARNEKKKKNNK